MNNTPNSQVRVSVHEVMDDGTFTVRIEAGPETTLISGKISSTGELDEKAKNSLVNLVEKTFKKLYGQDEDHEV